jgi:hypothetical protein
VAGIRTRGNARAAAWALAAACGYALTATLLKSAMAALDQGVGAFFSTWELYGTAIAGVGALFLLQNALQAGSLVAVQPPLTLGDALISACYGVTVFGEDVQTGGWLLAAEIVAVLAIAVGCIELSRSLALVHVPKQAELAGAPGADRVPCRGLLAGGRLAAARGHRPARHLTGATRAGPRRRYRGPARRARGPRPPRPDRGRPCRAVAGRGRRRGAPGEPPGGQEQLIPFGPFMIAGAVLAVLAWPR